MSDINISVVGGRLTADPLTFSDGAVCRFSVASNRAYRTTGATDWSEDVLYIDVTAFAGLAGRAARLRKADRVVVSGRLERNQYTADDGTKRTSIRLVASEISSEALYRKADAPAEVEEPAVAATVGADKPKPRRRKTTPAAQ